MAHAIDPTQCRVPYVYCCSDIKCIDLYSPTNLISEKSLHLLKRPLFKVEHFKRLELNCLATEHKPKAYHTASPIRINSLIHLEELRISLYFDQLSLFPLKQNNPINTQNLNWRLTLPMLKVFDLVNENDCGSYSFNVNASRLHSPKLMFLTNACTVDLDHPVSVRNLWIGFAKIY